MILMFCLLISLILFYLFLASLKRKNTAKKVKKALENEETAGEKFISLPTEECKMNHRQTTVKPKVSPTKLKEKPKFKLMDVWNNNNHILQIDDFNMHDQMLGRGTYGEVCYD